MPVIYDRQDCRRRSSRARCYERESLRDALETNNQLLNPENPFILVHNPIVSNYDISLMVDAHKKRREVDKNVIMTMGVARGGRQHPESTVMLVHPKSSRLLHYSLNPLSPRKRRVEFPANLFLDPWPASIDEYEIWSGTSASSSRGGYRDVGIDICEADVPALCTENFDYHDLRRHFVNGVLTSELLGKNINVHLVGEEKIEEKADAAGKGGRYVERIRDTRTYGEIAQDILRRWVYPLVPDVNLPGVDNYELRRGNVYVSRDNVMLARTTDLLGPVLIGAHNTLSPNVTVSKSTLGSKCFVGANTTIESTHIFTNARIGADCKLEECMIGSNVTLGDGVVVGKGTLIGNDVVIGPGVQIPEFSRIGRVIYRPDDWDSEDEDNEEHEEAMKNHSLTVLGPDSKGFLWPTEEEEPVSDSDDEDEDPYEHPRNKRWLQLGRRLSDVSVYSEGSLSTLSIASTTPDDSVMGEDDFASDIEMEVAGLNLNDGPSEAFYTEARSSLARAYEEGHSVANASLELKTLVMGYNSGIDAAREEVVNFLMTKIPTEGGAAQILEKATALWERWGGLASGLARDGSDIALDAQTFAVKNPAYIPWFGLILRSLYDSDIVDEEGLIEWRSLSAAQGEGADEGERERYRTAFAKGKQYVDVLEQMDSDSDEDDDDEEEESDDE